MATLDWLQFVATIVLIAMLYIYHRQMQTMQEQLAVSREASVAQNLIALASMLQAEDVRAARTHLIMTTRGKDYTSWNEADRSAAAKVCATYGPTGMILKTSHSLRTPIFATFGPSIRECYSVLKPFIENMQQPHKGGPDYLANVVWLYGQIKSSTR